MTDYLKTLGVSIENFYRELRDVEGLEDYQTNLFIECLIASTTYESFYKVMARSGLKKKEMMLQSSNGNILKSDEKISTTSGTKYPIKSSTTTTTASTQQRAEAKGGGNEREEKFSK